MTNTIADVIVVGSGISGAMMARGLVDAGLSVTMLDPGIDDDLRSRIPELPFSQVRATHRGQRSFFIGDNLEGVPGKGVRVGAQLTPPRQFIQRGADQLLPFQSDTFFPLFPVSMGGLGAGWGAACFTFDSSELARMGITGANMEEYYQQAADIVGISADPHSPGCSDLWQGVTRHQPPLDIDTNAETILDRARQCGPALERLGFSLGRIPMAILSEDRPPRGANPYSDMDFYGDVRRSIFRPRYLIEDLRKDPRFTYIGNRLVVRFEDAGHQVVLHSRDILTGTATAERARKAVICAGALNSARIALNSLGIVAEKTPILCNPYVYMPTVNLAMLGRKARDRRHSMAQLGGILRLEGSAEAYGCHQMYSYRSLLLFKLVKEMPLPPELGLLTARVLVNAMAIFGIFFADQQQDTKHLELLEQRTDVVPAIRMDYLPTDGEISTRRRHERIFSRALRKLHCFPIGRIDPGRAASIHYAGTIPYENPLIPRFHTNPDCTLEGAPNVYLGDGSPWNFLPSKGLSFTLMANALRVAGIVERSFRCGS